MALIASSSDATLLTLKTKTTLVNAKQQTTNSFLNQPHHGPEGLQSKNGHVVVAIAQQGGAEESPLSILIG